MNLEKDHPDVYILLKDFKRAKQSVIHELILNRLETIRADVVFELGLRYGEFDEYLNNNQKKNKEATIKSMKNQ